MSKYKRKKTNSSDEEDEDVSPSSSSSESDEPSLQSPLEVEIKKEEAPMEIEKSEEFGQSLPSPPSTPDSENWKERVRERTKESLSQRLKLKLKVPGPKPKLKGAIRGRPRGRPRGGGLVREPPYSHSLYLNSSPSSPNPQSPTITPPQTPISPSSTPKIVHTIQTKLNFLPATPSPSIISINGTPSTPAPSPSISIPTPPPVFKLPTTETEDMNSVPVSVFINPSDLSTLNTILATPLNIKDIRKKNATAFLFFHTPPHRWHPRTYRFHYPVISIVPLSKRAAIKSRILAKLQSQAPIAPTTPTAPLPQRKASLEREDSEVDSSDFHRAVGKIVEAIKALGGSGTGNQIAHWITKHYGDDAFNKKRLPYTVNAVLSAKKHAHIFVKEMVIVDGNKRALWRLADESIDIGKDLLKEPDNKKKELSLEEPMDFEVDTEAYLAYLDRDTFGGVDIDVDTEDEEATDVEGKSSSETISTTESSQSTQQGHHVEKMEIAPEAKEHDEEILDENETIEDVPEDEGQAEASERKEVEAEESEGAEGSVIEDMDELAEDDDKISDPGEEDDEEIIDEQLEEDEEGEDGEAEDDDDDDDKGDSEKPRSKRKKSKPAYSNRRKTKYEEEGEGSEGENSSTYTEMIEQALRALGGRGTGVEITTYIDDHYSSVLSNKTKTWRNSVMGCLSANRRNLFAKEPVKQNAKRYVWKLNDNPDAVTPDSKKSSSHDKRKAKDKDKDKETSESMDPSKNSNDKKSKDKKKGTSTGTGTGTGTGDAPADEHNDGDKAKEHTPKPTPSEDPSPPLSEGEHGDYVKLIEEALRELGGKASGSEISEWIAKQHKEHAMNKKKLVYTVNAILSSKKYRSTFGKEPSSVQGRTIWRLISKSQKT